jgi:CheY-like chemotaxis protein
MTKKMVLVVEDDQDIQEYFRIILGEEEYQLTHAANGVEALRVLDSGLKVDLILLDLVMPLMSGEEFFRILRQERGLSTPVILCSVDETRARPLETFGQLDGVFTKGLRSADLKEMISRALVQADARG